MTAAQVFNGSCLCGAVAWRAGAPLSLMSHCHCSRCRKAHGAAFGTYVGTPAESFEMLRGAGQLRRYTGASGTVRPFCGGCGSVVPDGKPAELGGLGSYVFVPAAGFDGALGVESLAHIFAASKAGWFEITDSAPQFDAYPPGFEIPLVADRPHQPEPGVVKGSCLCGAVSYRIQGEPKRARYCHCSRCRKARSAAHAANLFVAAADIEIEGDENLLSFKLPGARIFTQVFCRHCGSPMPRVDPERDLATVPMGSLDDDPGIRADCHIFVADAPDWYRITDPLPRYDEYPP